MRGKIVHCSTLSLGSSGGSDCMSSSLRFRGELVRGRDGAAGRLVSPLNGVSSRFARTGSAGAVGAVIDGSTTVSLASRVDRRMWRTTESVDRNHGYPQRSPS